MLKKIIQKAGSISKWKFYYQRSIESYNKREHISEKIAKRIGTSVYKGKSLIDDIEVTNDLKTKGYINFGKILNDDQVNTIINSLSKLKCYDPFRPHLGDFNFDEIPEEVHVANYKRKDLARVSQIIDIANDPKILSIAQDFLGATPTISNINCWWSMSNKEKAEQAQLFHRDVDDYRFCKIFIYLTDVSLVNGPHVFVENSPATNTLTKIRRYQDKEIEEEFGKENIKYFTGEKGSMFMVNTYGFHKGLLPERDRRLLLQVQYSLNPIAIEDYSPILVDGFPELNSYVNRLIIKKT